MQHQNSLTCASVDSQNLLLGLSVCLSVFVEKNKELSCLFFKIKEVSCNEKLPDIQGPVLQFLHVALIALHGIACLKYHGRSSPSQVMCGQDGTSTVVVTVPPPQSGESVTLSFWGLFCRCSCCSCCCRCIIELMLTERLTAQATEVLCISAGQAWYRELPCTALPMSSSLAWRDLLQRW